MNYRYNLPIMYMFTNLFDNLCLTKILSGTMCLLGSVKLVELILYGKKLLIKKPNDSTIKNDNSSDVESDVSETGGELETVYRDVDTMVANTKTLLNIYDD